MSTTLATLIAVCAPLVHPTTMQALVRVESAGNPYAVSINRPTAEIARGRALPVFEQPRSRNDAQRLIEALHASGLTTSVGLVQINTEHLARFGLQLTDLLDPCENLQVAQRVLLDCAGAGAAVRLDSILSCFNSGDATTGIRNGYAARIRTAAQNANYIANQRSPR